MRKNMYVCVILVHNISIWYLCMKEIKWEWLLCRIPRHKLHTAYVRNTTAFVRSWSHPHSISSNVIKYITETHFWHHCLKIWTNVWCSHRKNVFVEYAYTWNTRAYHWTSISPNSLANGEHSGFAECRMSGPALTLCRALLIAGLGVSSSLRFRSPRQIIRDSLDCMHSLIINSYRLIRRLLRRSQTTSSITNWLIQDCTHEFVEFAIIARYRLSRDGIPVCGKFSLECQKLINSKNKFIIHVLLTTLYIFMLFRCTKTCTNKLIS